MNLPERHSSRLMGKSERARMGNAVQHFVSSGSAENTSMTRERVSSGRHQVHTRRRFVQCLNAELRCPYKLFRPMLPTNMNVAPCKLRLCGCGQARRFSPRRRRNISAPGKRLRFHRRQRRPGLEYPSAGGRTWGMACTRVAFESATSLHSWPPRGALTRDSHGWV